MKIRPLQRDEIGDLWSIDRTERIERMVRFEAGELVYVDEPHDVTGWPVGEPERDEGLLRDCFDHGGTFLGAFDGDALVGAVVLESRFIGPAGDRLQLKFLFVSRAQRGTGLGQTLFERAAARARELGARGLYVSATPSENTIRFYLKRGCRVAEHLDPALFGLEPEDIHLDCELEA